VTRLALAFATAGLPSPQLLAAASAYLTPSLRCLPAAELRSLGTSFGALGHAGGPARLPLRRARVQPPGWAFSLPGRACGCGWVGAVLQPACLGPASPTAEQSSKTCHYW
jgi:hypothetical protein